MKKTLRILTVLLIGCLLLTSCERASTPVYNKIVVTDSLKGKETLVGNLPCDFPLVTEPTSLNILINPYESTNPSDVYVWNKYEEMTGVSICWTAVNKNERSEAVNTALLNQNKIDLILRCKISATNLAKYGENGLILNLMENDLLKTYAPNCYAFLQSHPDALASVTNPDGSVYSLPQVNFGAELRVTKKLFVNKKWLENTGMELPTTTEELYQLLKVFKDQDANGNGDPNDEIPLASHDWSSIQDFLLGAFGLANRGIHNQTVDFDEVTQKARLVVATDEYKDYLMYLNRLYTEGLLDKYIFTTSTEQWLNYIATDRIGVFSYTNLAGVPADKADDWIAIEEALEGPNGDKLWTAIRANFHSVGAAVIPAACSDPALVLKWLDYFWTDEGTLFYHMGIEGETFMVNEDGSYDYLPFIYEEMKSEGKSYDDIVARYSPYPGGGNPTVETAPYFMGGEMADIPAKAAIGLFAYGPSEYWPSFTFTAEENNRLSIYKSDMEKYCSSSRIAFITGEKPFSEWDSYLTQLDKFGKEDMLSVYQAAIDRYYALLRSLKK